MYFIEGLPSVNEDPPNNDASDPVVLDTDSLAFLRRDREERSVAMTHLASEIGSVVGTPRNARIKSFTYYPSDNDVNSDATGVDWILDLADGKIARKPRVIVHAVDGVLAAVSRIQVGDYLQSINDTKIGTRWDAAQAQQHLQTRLATDGYLSVATVDPQGDEVWIQATIVKPRPDMTLTDLGMTVWVWGYVSQWLFGGICANCGYKQSPSCQTTDCELVTFPIHVL